MKRANGSTDAGIRPCMGGAMLLVLVTMVVTQTAAARPDAPTVDRPGGRPQTVERVARHQSPDGLAGGVRRTQSESSSGGAEAIADRSPDGGIGPAFAPAAGRSPEELPGTCARARVRQGLLGLAPPCPAGA